MSGKSKAGERTVPPARTEAQLTEQLAQADERLRESQALLAEVQRVASVGSWWQDFPSGQVGWTDETSRQLGYEPGKVDISFDAFITRVHPDDRAHAIEAIGAGMSNCTAFAFRARYYLPNGESGFFLSRGEVVQDAGGQVLRMVGTIQDITTQVAAESAFEQRVAELNAEREGHREARALAELANAAKSDFLATMSHELRTPLNSIIGFADILLKNKAKNFTDKDLGYVDRIQANGRDLLGLINRVLDLSKVEAGEMSLEITSVPLCDVVRETLAEFEPQAAARNVRVVSELPDAPCLLDTDRAKLKQILVNLVGNAVKFSAEGEVRVSVRVDPASGQPVRIDVVDTGIGIPADRMHHIFEPFQQADNSTAREHGGTGLGLTISRALAQLMGFDITVTSELGAGATFSIVFVPDITAPAVGSVAMALSQVPAREERGFLVLVIDDDADARVILKRAFEDLGCSVVTAAGVDEGLALARTVCPGMITIDLMMPRKSGWDALRELQADPQLRTIPVVVVSAVASENRALLSGALDYLDKPVAREELARVVGRSAAPRPDDLRQRA